jgi:bifunctional non-homologous end joining protein LigD
MRLSRRLKSFDSADYVFELKHDGFRALAYIENGQCRLVSRNGNRIRSFGTLEQWIGKALKTTDAILDGEVVCLDESGRSVFKDVLFRRGECRFFAFDVLWLNGEDLRGLPLVERKARLKKSSGVGSPH